MWSSGESSGDGFADGNAGGKSGMLASHAKMNLEDKTIIGWTEYVSFTEWGIENVKAKTDTGARSSALHVENLRDLENGYVMFDVAMGRRKPYEFKRVVAEIARKARVRSSNGDYGNRYFVRTGIKIGPIEKKIDLSLVSREKMLFRMLLGRKSLDPEFLVDAGRQKVLTRRSPKQPKAQ